MSPRLYALQDEGFSHVIDLCRSFGPRSEKILNDVIHDDAGPIIYGHINPLIHPSGRTWSGKPKAAVTANWPDYDIRDHLAVTVGTKPKWLYLYFPDDGSTTRGHAGGQMFMKRGAEAAAPSVAELAAERLCAEFN